MKYLKLFEGFKEDSAKDVINSFNKAKKLADILGINIEAYHLYKKTQMSVKEEEVYEFILKPQINKYGLISLMFLPLHNFQDELEFDTGVMSCKKIAVNISNKHLKYNIEVFYVNDDSLYLELLNLILFSFYTKYDSNIMNVHVGAPLKRIDDSMKTILQEIYDSNSDMNIDMNIPQSVFDLINKNIRNYSNPYELVNILKKKNTYIYNRIDKDLKKGDIKNMGEMGLFD
jgi:hypothetical protein